MTKKKKLTTPEWIMQGFDSPKEYEKSKGKTPKKKEKDNFKNSGIKKSEKTFNVRKCPKCGSDDVRIVLSGINSEDGGGNEWECHVCGWVGKNIIEEGLNEDELMKYMDKTNKGGSE